MRNAGPHFSSAQGEIARLFMALYSGVKYGGAQVVPEMEQKLVAATCKASISFPELSFGPQVYFFFFNFTLLKHCDFQSHSELSFRCTIFQH